MNAGNSILIALWLWSLFSI